MGVSNAMLIFKATNVPGKINTDSRFGGAFFQLSTTGNYGIVNRKKWGSGDSIFRDGRGDSPWFQFPGCTSPVSENGCSCCRALDPWCPTRKLSGSLILVVLRIRPFPGCFGTGGEDHLPNHGLLFPWWTMRLFGQGFVIILPCRGKRSWGTGDGPNQPNGSSKCQTSLW